MRILDFFGKDAIEEMDEDSKSNNFKESYSSKKQHIVGIILLPIIFFLQLRMIAMESYFNLFAGGEIGARSWVTILGMSFWWIVLYSLLKKDPIPIFKRISPVIRYPWERTFFHCLLGVVVIIIVALIVTILFEG